jgi:hypothetical protein
MAPLERESTQGHEVGVLFEALAPTQEQANAVSIAARYAALHHAMRPGMVMVSNMALPHSPPEMPRGPAYRFTMHHVVEPASPTEMFRTEWETV